MTVRDSHVAERPAEREGNILDTPMTSSRPDRDPRARRVLGLLLLVLSAGALLEADVDRQAVSVAWLSIGPLVASLLLPWRRTALVGAYALLLGTLVLLDRPTRVAGEVFQLLVLAGLSGFAVANCVLRERREQRLRRMTEIARVAQEAILRPVPSSAGQLRFGVRYSSAEEEAQVGGDLYDVRPTARGARVLVGDVRGKGLPAVQLAAAVLASFREACARPGLSLPEVTRQVDLAVELLAGDEEFVTAVFVEVDERGWLEVVNCGHPPPLRRATDGRVSALSPREAATPLGLAPQPHCDTYAVAPGDRLVLYTDGVLEARDPDGQFLPLDRHVAGLDAPDADAAAGQLLHAATQHARGRLDDDVAVVVVDFDRPEGVPRSVVA